MATVDAKTSLDGLTWPGSTVSLSGLLAGLQFIGTDVARQDAAGQKAWDAETPGSLQVLKSGVTNLTRIWLKRAGAVGGGTALLTGIGGTVIAVVEPFRKALGEPIAITLLAATALIISATVLAAALFVTGDLQARAQATAARTAARAEVAATFLRAVAPLPRPDLGSPDVRAEVIALIGAFKKLYVRTRTEPSWHEADAVRQDGSEGFQIHLKSGDWVPLAQVENYTTLP